MKKLLCLVLLLTPRLSADAQVTIDNLLGVPFPSDLVVSRDGKIIACVLNDRGARNIYVASVPDFKPAKITNYTLDDGQEIGSLDFTPDGDRITFVRGGAPNSQSELPNPTAMQEGIDRALWIVGVDGSNLTKLGSGYGSKPSPDGKLIAYHNKGKVWTVNIDSAGKGSKLFDTRGSVGTMVWSPDGSMLAFESSRGDHAFIGVYDIAASSLKFLDPSVDHDQEPVWSADGKRIAFFRVPNTRDLLPFAPAREGLPWSIRVAEVATGKSREIWKADEGSGSVYYDDIPVNSGLLRWMGNRLIFPWEKDGWQHLYSVPSSGGTAQLLTPGDGEIEYVTATRDNQSLIYVTNIGDISRRHLWKVGIEGGRAEPLTRGDGIEFLPVETSSGIVCLRADATTAAWPHLVTSTQKFTMLFQELFPKSFPKKDLVTPQVVTITATDGMKIPGQLFLPKNHKAGDKHPAVIFFHGGSRRQMLPAFHYSGYYHNAYSMNQYLASQGYVVLAVNYRSGIGYGMEFREALNYGAAGASEYGDVVGAGLYLTERADVDASRIGLWGGSYGGYLTALGLSRASDLFACGVDLHGVHDWNEVVKNFVPSYNAEKRAAFSRKAFESSPMNFLDGWKSPVLVIHGDDDRNVPFSETVTLVESLRERNVHVEQLIFPDEVHGFLLHRNWADAYKAAAEFFDRMLKGKSGP